MELIERKTWQEIAYNAKLKILPNDKYKLTCFSYGIFTEKGWESSEPKQKVKRADVTEDEAEKRRKDSLKRAKDKIFEIAIANDWQYMITLTLDKEKINRTDPKEIIKPFGTWLHNQASRNGLKYIIVPEYHEKGGIHFHGLINNALKFDHSGAYRVEGHKAYQAFNAS